MAIIAGTLNVLKNTPAQANFSSPCTTAGTWVPGELNIYWFDVEQGDSQLIVGPTGSTMLIDLGERSWKTTGDNTNSALVADQIRTICGVRGSVRLDYVLASHHHRDHIGFAANPNDPAQLGNGIYRLLSPKGENFTVGALLDRDSGEWADANRDGDCDVGSAAFPADEIEWRNAGKVGSVALRWICWLYGPDGQPDRSNIAGKVVTLSSSKPWPAIDMGPGTTARIVQANAKGVAQADGTPASGDHTRDPIPIAENDYSVAIKIGLGPFSYATAGDTNGEFASGRDPDFTYNDVEASLIAAFGDVDALRANHHGSAHSSSGSYINGLNPETAFISCGENSVNQPANRTLDAFRRAGADVYLTNKPCAPNDADGSPINYEGTFNRNGVVRLATTGGGSGYEVTYDEGVRSYRTGLDASDPKRPGVVINEYLMTPGRNRSEWVELFNPSPEAVDLGAYSLDDRPDGGGSPQLIAAGTSLPPGGRLVIELPGDFLADDRDDSVRLLSSDGTVVDSHLYMMSGTQVDRVIRRMGDGGSWCATFSPAATPGETNPAGCP